MGKKTLINAHCLLELIEKSPVSILSRSLTAPKKH